MTSVNVLPLSDWIVALSSCGEISEQGTFEHLSKSGGYISSFSLNSSTQEVIVKHGSATEKSPDSEQAVAVSDISPDSKRQFGDISTYLYYFRSIGWTQSITFLFLMASFAFFLTFPVCESSYAALRSLTLRLGGLAELVGKCKYQRPWSPNWIMVGCVCNFASDGSCITLYWRLVYIQFLTPYASLTEPRI